MKTLATVLILAFQFVSTARAQPAESDHDLNALLSELTRVDVESDLADDGEFFRGTDRLRVVGRGVQNRKTKDVIALACVGPQLATGEGNSCLTLQHFKFAASGTHQTIGPSFQLSLDHEPTMLEFKELSKIENKTFKNFKKDHNTENRKKWQQRVGGVVFSGLAVGLVLMDKAARAATGLPLATGPALLGMAAVSVGTMAVYLLSDRPLMATNGMVSEAIANQNSWNWTSNPRRVSKRAFQWFERYLTEGAMPILPVH